MSPKLVKTTPGRAAISIAASINSTWAVHQLDAVGQQRFQSVFDDGVRLAAANLHQRPRTGNRAVNLSRKGRYDPGVAVLIDELHRRGSRIAADE
jgi:hypothetical protein